MRSLLDTSIAILLRDGDEAISSRVSDLAPAPMLSIISLVELEGGIHRDADRSSLLRARLDAMLRFVEILPFTETEAAIYGRIVSRCGFSRGLVIDRMIAAQAIAADATLITLNPRDFRPIPGLKMEDWTIPARV